MAATTEAMKSSVVTIRKLTADERIRMQCEARELQLLDMRTRDSLMKKAQAGRKQAEIRAEKAEERQLQAEARAEKAEAERQKAEAEKQKAEARIQELELLLARQTGERKER